jgi:DUF2946 family protein
VRRQPPLQRRPRIGLLGRAASWLVAFALLVQCGVGAGAALAMWIEANGPGQTAAGHCAQHGNSGKQDQGSGGASHDHEHCLLCNITAADCPTPILPLLSAALDRSIVPAPAPAIIAFRKVAYANAARGPPRPD